MVMMPWGLMVAMTSMTRRGGRLWVSSGSLARLQKCRWPVCAFVCVYVCLDGCELDLSFSHHEQTKTYTLSINVLRLLWLH